MWDKCGKTGIKWRRTYVLEAPSGTTPHISEHMFYADAVQAILKSFVEIIGKLQSGFSKLMTIASFKDVIRCSLAADSEQQTSLYEIC